MNKATNKRLQSKKVLFLTTLFFAVTVIFTLPTQADAYDYYRYNNNIQNNWAVQQQYYTNYDWTDIPMRQSAVQNINHNHSNNQYNNSWHNSSNNTYRYDNQYQAYFYTIGGYQPQAESRFYRSAYDQYYFR